ALLEAAIAAGAVFRQSSVEGLLFTDGPRQRVVGAATAHGDVRAPVVVGADGATSIVARSLGVSRLPERARSLAIRGYVEIDGGDAELLLHFFSEAQPAYGWFFPCGDGLANVGVFLRRSTYARRHRPLRALLGDYLGRPDVRRRIRGRAPLEVASWQLPLFDRGRPRVFPGALLVGDAGGFINPFTGAGIYEAMATGRAAAATILDAAARGDLGCRGLAPYNAAWEAELGRSLIFGALAQEGLTRAPWAMELAFPAAGALTPLTRVLSHWMFSTRR
ncbi:MAG: NAD(P)/FAD-dependent oxidoreductase, partial [Myxococcales bacterium]|nr:NAD(P)/FAD-dependent oxidoreductase [Myxococcales bacterium]